MSGEVTYYPVQNPNSVDIYTRGGLGVGGLESSKSEIDGEEGMVFHASVGLEKRLGGLRAAMGFGVNFSAGSFATGNAYNVDAVLQFTWFGIKGPEGGKLGG